MADQYVTDPDLLRRLNEGVGNQEYVTDPALLDRLNQSEMADPGRAIVGEMGVMAARPATQAAVTAANIPIRGVQDVASIARNLPNISAEGWKEMARHPLLTAKAYLQGHPNLGPVYETLTNPQAMKTAAGRGMSALGSAVLSPEAILAAPYMMTAYEMEKIRANPQAYPNVPYAQVLRGEQPTIGAAGRANVRRAITQTPSGYQPTATEAENILASGDERMMRIYGGRDALTQMVRRKAAEKVFAQ